MGKFIAFVVALCLIQAIPSTVAQTEDEINIQNVVGIISQLAKEIEDAVKGLPQRLPQLIKDLEESIRTIVEDVKIVEVFENLKIEIENIVGKGTSKAGCSKQANDKLEDLNEKTSKEIADCLEKTQKNALDIKDKVENLLKDSNSLAVDVANRLQTCVKKFGEEDPAGLSSCLESEVDTVKETLKELKVTIAETVDVSEELVKDIGVQLRSCMENVKQNAYNNSNKVINGVKNCVEEL